MRSGVIALLGLMCLVVGTVVEGQQQKAVVSFTFDDGRISSFTYGLPILRTAGFTATAYVITGETGDDDAYLNREQISMLHASGWEIASHTRTHPNIVQIPSGQAFQELMDSKQDLMAQGIQARSFASPYGEVDPSTMRMIRQIYRSHRRAWGGGVGDKDGLNLLPGFDPYELSAFEVKRGTGSDQIAMLLDEAIREGRWLILMFHIVSGNPPEFDTQISTEQFREIVGLVAERQDQLVVRTVGEMTAKKK